MTIDVYFLNPQKGKKGREDKLKECKKGNWRHRKMSTNDVYKINGNTESKIICIIRFNILD